MCDLTPFGLKCKRDKCPHSAMCYIHLLVAVVMRLCQMIPVIGNFLDGYCCHDFQVEQEADADE